MKLVQVYQYPANNWLSFRYAAHLFGITSDNRLRIRDIIDIPAHYIPMKCPVKHTEES